MDSIKKNMNLPVIKMIDFIPAISGLIGKVALVTSFASVWAQELSISSPNFVLHNVRIEIIIGSVITLILSFILPNASPAGTLAPLIVLIPSMAGFGVHPFVLSLMVGIIGIICVKANLFSRLISLSGNTSKASLTLAFGVSGVLLSAQNLISFFEYHLIPLLVLAFLLASSYFLLLRYRKSWLIIPVAAVISILVPQLFGQRIEYSVACTLPNFNPFYWWNDMWGIGFGTNIITILKTLPFALFVILLWAIDTVSINAIIDAHSEPNERREEINLNDSFIIISVRNIVGGILGGAQTSSLWRSFLIPLFMMKRPIHPSAMLLGMLGIVAGITAAPLAILSFPPLIWSVLLFGIFIPFVAAGLKNMKNADNTTQRGIIVSFAAVGVLVSPIAAWLGAICYEKVRQSLHNKHLK